MQCKDIPTEEVLSLIGERGGYPAFERLVEKYLVEKVVLTKLNRLSDKGLIDYGVSVRGAWLTPKGRQWLLLATR